MRKRGFSKLKSPTSANGEAESNGGSGAGEAITKDNSNVVLDARRPTNVVLGLLVLVIYGGWGVYRAQFKTLPAPLTLEQAGQGGFSEYEAMKHVEALTALGPHPVGSVALETAVQYVAKTAEIIKQAAPLDVNVEVDLFHSKPGAHNQLSGFFEGKSLAYADLYHVIIRITPKNSSEASERAILVSSHFDSVFAGEGAGDCSSCVAVILELARGVSQSAQGFKNAVIFLLNTGEEEGLNGAHSFITQHPWSETVRVAVDLEAMGIGGKSTMFQAGPDPWALDHFASVAKYPSAQIITEDIFSSGFIQSATDFQVYKEIGGLSGLDFAHVDDTAVYHTKNDKLERLGPGSLQHIGENMLAFLLHAAASPTLEESKPSNHEKVIYFDILGTYMITFRQSLATMVYTSAVLLTLCIWAKSLSVSVFYARTALALSCLSLLLMWVFSIGLSAIVAFILPTISSSAVPYVSHPWLVLGLFGAPALLGAFAGQHIGYIILTSYLVRKLIERRINVAPDQLTITNLAKIDAERWLFKSGLVQWLAVLMLGTYLNIGSSYLAFAWFAAPALAYGFLEATARQPLKTETLLIGMSLPFLLTSGVFIRLANTLIGNFVRYERDPGANPEWMPNVVIAVFVAAVVCLTLVYLLSYIHISVGAKVPLIIGTSSLLVISLAGVWGGVVPPFTQHTVRAVNVVHVVDARGENGVVPYISMFSTTPGNLIKEVDHVGEGFVCGWDRYLDFVTFSVNYGCWTEKGAENGWLESDIPSIHVTRDIRGQRRSTEVVIDTTTSHRWALGINTKLIEDFQLKIADSEEVLIPPGEKMSVDGKHTIQFAGGRNAPTRFHLSMLWHANATPTAADDQLLGLRTDMVDRVTPPMEKIIGQLLPPWCSLYGKSTSPHTFSVLRSLPVSFQVMER